MLIIGKSQKLKIGRAVDFGLYLTDGKEEVLLPNKYVPIGSKIGEDIEVFIYTDSEDRPIATTLKPIGEVDDLVTLKVQSVGKFGAFADIGLEKDLLIPFKEQDGRLEEGRNAMVKILLDHRTGRMIGTTKVHSFLSKDTVGYAEGAEVQLFIWKETELGWKVIINNSIQGLLYKNEVFESITTGDERGGFIKKIREDGKIDVALRKQGYQGVKDMSQLVMDKVVENGGVLLLGDKSNPEEIKRLLGISKKNFKKIIGGLYKAGKLEISDFEVRKKD